MDCKKADFCFLRLASTVSIIMKDTNNYYLLTKWLLVKEP